MGVFGDKKWLWGRVFDFLRFPYPFYLLGCHGAFQMARNDGGFICNCFLRCLDEDGLVDF